MRLPKPIVRLLNLFVVALLRSPMHRLLSDKLVVLSVTGRRTGTVYTFPVSYLDGGASCIDCFTQNAWWKNIDDGATVGLRLRGMQLRAVARTETREVERIAQGLARLFEKTPADAAYYGVVRSREGPGAEDLRRAAASSVMITLCWAKDAHDGP